MNDWIKWDGGVCPVPKGTKIELRFRDNDGVDCETDEPEDYRWTNENLMMDIMAYRVIGDFAIDGAEYAYGCNVKVPDGRQIEPCRWSGDLNVPTHWRLKPLACCGRTPCQRPGVGPCDKPAPIEVALQSEADRLKAADDFMSALQHTGPEIGLTIVSTGNTTPTAIDLLNQAGAIQAERAREYEQAGGERSTAKIVAAFNAITGRDLRESEGWLFLQLLKMVRSEAGGIHSDSVLDSVSYASLYGEARLAGK